MRRDPMESFVEKVAIMPDGCWPWTAHTTGCGYGYFYDPAVQRKEVAHRWAYKAVVGPIPEGLDLDHLCRVRHCVNPDHLEPVTRRENLLRGIGLPAQRAKQTHCKRGHEFTSVNTYITGRGERHCRTCGRERKAAERAGLLYP